MASSKYTAVRDRDQLEAYVNNTPNFKRVVRFEPHEEREGYLVITDGSYSFGMMPEENVQKVLNDEVQPDDLESKPEILKHISCYDIDINTKRFAKEASKTAMDKLEEKVSFFAPNKKMLVALAIIIVLAIAVPFVSMRIFSKASSGYSDDFYNSDRLNNRLQRFKTNWTKFAETEATYDQKMAEHLVAEITEFSNEVDKERLAPEQKEALQWLIDNTQKFSGK